MTDDEYCNLHYSEILEAYQSLPEERRYVANVAETLRASGRSVSLTTVRDTLRDILIAEVSDADIAAAARTLRVVAELGDPFYGEGTPNVDALKAGKQFVWPFLDRLTWTKLNVFAFALARTLGAHRDNSAPPSSLPSAETVLWPS